jgi:hypothetical protein
MDNNNQLFTVTEKYKGHCVHWYVIWRKHPLDGVPDTAQEFFTEQEATIFVDFARVALDIPQLTVAPAPSTAPIKSWADQMTERGEEPEILLVGDENANFGVGCL